MKIKDGTDDENLKEGAGAIAVPEKTIRKLADLLKTTDLAEIEIASKDVTIRVRSREYQPTVTVASVPAQAPVSQASTAKPKALDAHSDLHIIRSPFIGTFYRAASPTSASYVEAGQTISKGTTLCIVEAMKMMNEIEADSAGVIEKIFVENGEPVEFNTALFGIRR